MKYKVSEVTNSSSTSFLMAFAGNHIGLYKAMLKYEDHFSLENDYWEGGKSTIDVWDVIQALDGAIKSNPEQLWLRPEIKTIDEAIKGLEEDAASWKNQIRESAEEDKSGDVTFDWEKEALRKAISTLHLLQKGKERGLTSVIKVGFGDNHGEISGDIVGCTMDYRGRHIRIDESDFIVVTEQNR